MKKYLAFLFVCLPIFIFGQSQDSLVGFFIVDGQNKQVVKFDPNYKGKYTWYYVDLIKYAPEVSMLHSKGQEFGRKGNLKEAIKNMEEAIQIQKEVPKIFYDLGYIYLMYHDSINALRCFKELDKIAPNGYFNNKLYISIIEDEITGKLPNGFCLLFTQIEDSPTSKLKIEYLEALLKSYDNYPPIVKEYIKSVNEDAKYIDLIFEALEKEIDTDTRGFLTNSLAMIYLKTDINQSIHYWNIIINDRNATIQWRELAKFLLKGYSN